MTGFKSTKSYANKARGQLHLLRAELQTFYREELQQNRLQYLEKIRQVEANRLRAEEELETLEDNFAELDERFRSETSRLNNEISLAKNEIVDLLHSQTELQKLLHNAESIQDEYLEQIRQVEANRLRAEEELETLEDNFAELDERFRSETSRLNNEISLAKNEIAGLFHSQTELQKLLRNAESIQDDLKQEKREIRDRLRAEEDECRKLKGELNTLKDRIGQLEKERYFYHRCMVYAEQQLHEVKRGLFRQVNQVMITGFSSWKGLANLPSTLWRTLRSSLFLQGRHIEALLDQIEEIFSTQGKGAAESFIRGNATGHVELASGLTKLARLVAREDLPASLSLAQEATKADPRPFRRKWLAFMFFDAGYIRAAHNLLNTLLPKADFKPSEKNKAAYIAGCHRLLDGMFPWPEMQTNAAYVPSPNRILYVAASSLPYHITGYTIRTHGLLQAIKKEGFDISCVTRPGYPADRSDSLDIGTAGTQVIDGITYEVLAGPHRRKYALDQYLLTAAECLTKKAIAEKVACIHAASNYEAALPALIAARKLGLPFIYEVRGLWEYTSASKKIGWEETERFALERQLETMTAQHADQVLTLTDALADELESRGVEKRKIALAGNAIDIQSFTPVPQNPALALSLGITKDDFVIGYVGSVVAYEGLDDLIEALNLLQGRLPQARVLIVGDGDALPGLQHLVKTKNLAKRIIFCGKVSPDQVRDYYALLDIAALPRKPVTVCQLVSPLKPLETMALGIPLVVSDVTALRQMVQDGETALIHFADNARSLADCIEILANNSELRDRIARNARQYVATHRTWHQVAGAIGEMYRPLIDTINTKPTLTSASHRCLDLEPIKLKAGNNGLDTQKKALLDQKLSTAINLGVEILHKFLSDQCQNRSKQFVTFCYLRAAQACLNGGKDIEAINLAEKVLREDNSATALRGAARVFHNLARLERTLDLTKQLERSLGTVKSNDRKFIDEACGRAKLATLATLPPQISSIPRQPKRVLNLLAFSLPYTSVGYATRSHGLAIGIKNAGWEIRPYTRPGFPYDFQPELNGQVLPEENEIDGILYQRIFDSSRKELSEVEYIFAAIEHYERIIRKEEPEIVHAASNYVTALPALIAARRMGVPFIYEVRGFWEVTRSSRDGQFENTPKYRFMQLFEGLTARHADHVITITTAMKEELISRGVAKERVTIAYNSVDPNRFTPRPADRQLTNLLNIPEDVPVIGYVGSFVDYEGLDDLITACAGLNAEGSDFRLLLVGDGVVFEDLKQQVQQSGLQDKTIMTGRVPHQMVEDYYSLIDIAPFPRKPWDVCELVSPLKPYEAMALEKAVVVSGTKALLEVVQNGQTGLVFEKGNVNELQRTLSNLLVNRDLRTHLGIQARNWILTERNWDVAGCKCIEIYQCVLDNLYGRSTVEEAQQ